MRLNGKEVKIIEHPLGKLVKKLWDEELTKRGYDKDINVNSLSDEVLHDVYKVIDRKVEPFFHGVDIDEMYNLRNAWNYQASHLRNLS